jgi:4-amino-4-deoxychorismate lyase
VSVWINGRRGSVIDCSDRGLQYGDGVFETLRVRGHRIRLLEFHLDRLRRSCQALKIAAPPVSLRRELERIAASRKEAVLKLIVTRGIGARGYRPSGKERSTRIISLHALRAGTQTQVLKPARLRLCATTLGTNPLLAGLKTLNRLESVLARAEWKDERIWEGLMQDSDGNWVCGTMSNLFLRRGTLLLTPLLDRCGVAGVMRRWILQNADALSLQVGQRRIAWQDLEAADEVFMSNAIVGIRSVGSITGSKRGALRYLKFDTAEKLRSLLDLQ